MKERLRGNNWGNSAKCFLRSASDKITWSSGSRQSFWAATHVTTSTLPIVLLQLIVSSANNSKNNSSSAIVVHTEKEKQSVYQLKAYGSCKGYG